MHINLSKEVFLTWIFGLYFGFFQSKLGRRKNQRMKTFLCLGLLMATSSEIGEKIFSFTKFDNGGYLCWFAYLK